MSQEESAEFKVVLIGMYPTEAFGVAPLALKAAVLARSDLEKVEVAVHFYQECAPQIYDVARIAERACDEAPKVVGIGCYLWNRRHAIELSVWLRRLLPGATLVVGGPEVETREAAEAILREGEFDIAVRGEGELVFADLVGCLRTGVLTENPLPGTSRWFDGHVVHETNSTPADPLDRLPSPFDARVGDFASLWRVPSFETYRGCIMRCKFCNWGKARGMRFFSLERVKRDLDFILSLDIKEIWFVDAVFNLSGDRYKEVLRYLNCHNRRGIVYSFEMMAELLDEEGVALIAEFPAGSTIAFGLQSTDPAVVREAARPHNWQRFSRAIRAVRERAPQVEVVIDLIYGMPGDRPVRFRKSLLDAVDLDPARVQVHPFRALVGTQFHDERESYGFREVGQGDLSVSVESGVTDEEIEEFRWYSYWSNVFLSPRHRRVIEDLHQRTSVARSALLAAFMAEYEARVGREQARDVQAHGPGWLAVQLEEVHSSLYAQFSSSRPQSCPPLGHTP